MTIVYEKLENYRKESPCLKSADMMETVRGLKPFIKKTM